MGVKIVKGIAGQYEALKSPSNQISQSKNSAVASSKAAQATSAINDAVVSKVRGGRPEQAERLSLEKAEEVAKDLKNEILSDQETALGAIGEEFSITAVRDAFGL